MLLHFKWSDVTWRDIRPSMVTHTRNLCSAFNPSNVHTHTVNTHPPWIHTRSSGQPFMLRLPGSSWGFGALLKDTSVVVLKVESCTFTPLTYNSCRPETWTHNLLDYESNSLTIRPRLPQGKAAEGNLWRIHLNEYDLERHTRLNKRSNSWKCISEQKPSPEVKRTVCRAQKQVCVNPHIWGRVQKKILLHWRFTEACSLCYP